MATKHVSSARYGNAYLSLQAMTNAETKRRGCFGWAAWVLPAICALCIGTAVHSSELSLDNHQKNDSEEIRDLKLEVRKLRRGLESLRREMAALRNIPVLNDAIKKHFETEAVLRLKIYATAQTTYHIMHSEYTNDYSILKEVKRNDEILELIDKRFAEARFAPTISKTAVQLDGYIFLDDQNISDWSKDFGLFAFPENIEDGHVFWIGTQGVVYWQSAEELIESGMRRPEDFVSPQRERGQWKILD